MNEPVPPSPTMAILGEANFGDPQGTFVARLENAYIFADGFESGSTSAW